MSTQRVAIVTGGSSGIGASLVAHFLSLSYRVLIADLNPPPSLPTSPAEGGATSPGNVLFHRTDVTSHVDLVEAFEKAKSAWKRIDVVCAIAGISQVFTDPEGKDPFLRSATLDPVTRELSAPNLKLIDINLKGVLNTVHVAIAYFRAQSLDTNSSRGSIVCAGSTASLYPFPNESLYGAAKHGVLGLVRSLAVTLKKEGIRINAIAPSLVETNIGNPEAFSVLREAGLLTPKSTINRAVGILSAPDAVLAGQIIECCLSTLSLRTPPQLANADEAKCMQMIWPWEEVQEALSTESVKGLEDVEVVS